MKKILISTILLAFVGFSCGDQLDLYPHSAISPGSVTEKDLDALEIGMYNKVQNDPPTEAWILNDLIGGTLTTSTSTPIDLINNTLSPLSSIVTNSWNGYYTALYQVNNLLEIAAKMSESSKVDRVQGVSLYFRAYIYYCLVTHWGDVPILRKNTLDLVSRDSEAEVWEFIVEDLNMAIDLLSGSTSYYYVSKDAAIALKARVLLSIGQFEEAAELAESLISSGKYHLDDHLKIFRKIENGEVIFAFENNTIESSNGISNLFYSYAHPNKGSYLYRPSPFAMNMYEDGDSREAIALDNVGGNNVINKYPSGQGGKDPVIISRIAEMYLISAEASGRQAGISRLNELRAKRGLGAVSVATDDEFIDAIILERERELLAENFIYYDLVRLDKAESKLGIQPYQMRLPIPSTELRLNPNLTQNAGY